MGFSRQESWSGLPCPPPGDLPNPGIEPTSLTSPALAGGFFTLSATWEGGVNWSYVGSWRLVCSDEFPGLPFPPAPRVEVETDSFPHWSFQGRLVLPHPCSGFQCKRPPACPRDSSSTAEALVPRGWQRMPLGWFSFQHPCSCFAFGIENFLFFFTSLVMHLRGCCLHLI